MIAKSIIRALCDQIIFFFAMPCIEFSIQVILFNKPAGCYILAGRLNLLYLRLGTLTPHQKLFLPDWKKDKQNLQAIGQPEAETTARPSRQRRGGGIEVPRGGIYEVGSSAWLFLVYHFPHSVYSPFANVMYE